jgi:hypothetical protein
MPPAADEAFDPASLQMDDRAINYIARARATYSDLRHVAAQLASLALAATLGGGPGLCEHPMLATVRETLSALGDDLWSGAPPPVARAHCDHLRRATALFVTAADDARQARGVEAWLQFVHQAWGEMHAAARALPGFAVVSFGQSCCAAHAAQDQQRFQAL